MNTRGFPGKMVNPQSRLSTLFRRRKKRGVPARERNSSIIKPDRSPVGSDGGTMRVHSRQSINNICAPAGGSGTLHRPVPANQAARSATVAALNCLLPIAFCQRSQRVPPSSRVK